MSRMNRKQRKSNPDQSHSCRRRRLYPPSINIIAGPPEVDISIEEIRAAYCPKSRPSHLIETPKLGNLYMGNLPTSHPHSRHSSSPSLNLKRGVLQDANQLLHGLVNFGGNLLADSDDTTLKVNENDTHIPGLTLIKTTIEKPTGVGFCSVPVNSMPGVYMLSDEELSAIPPSNDSQNNRAPTIQDRCVKTLAAVEKCSQKTTDEIDGKLNMLNSIGNYLASSCGANSDKQIETSINAVLDALKIVKDTIVVKKSPIENSSMTNDVKRDRTHRSSEITPTKSENTDDAFLLFKSTDVLRKNVVSVNSKDDHVHGINDSQLSNIDHDLQYESDDSDALYIHDQSVDINPSDADNGLTDKFDGDRSVLEDSEETYMDPHTNVRRKRKAIENDDPHRSHPSGRPHKLVKADTVHSYGQRTKPVDIPGGDQCREESNVSSNQRQIAEANRSSDGEAPPPKVIPLDMDVSPKDTANKNQALKIQRKRLSCDSAYCSASPLSTPSASRGCYLATDACTPSSHGLTPENLRQESPLSTASSKMRDTSLLESNSERESSLTPVNNNYGESLTHRFNSSTWCPICKKDIDGLKLHAFNEHVPWYISVHEDRTTDIPDSKQTALCSLVMSTVSSGRVARDMPCFNKLFGELLDGLLQFLVKEFGQTDVDSLYEFILVQQIWPDLDDLPANIPWQCTSYQEYTTDTTDSLEFSPPSHPSALLHWTLLLHLISQLPRTSQKTVTTLEKYSIPTSDDREVHRDISNKFFSALRLGDWSDLKLLLDNWPGVVHLQTNPPDGSGPIWHALHHEQYLSPIVLYLHGADPRQINHKQRTPLLCATRAGDQQAIAIMEKLCRLRGHLGDSDEHSPKKADTNADEKEIEGGRDARRDGKSYASILKGVFESKSSKAEGPTKRAPSKPDKPAPKPQMYNPFVTQESDEEDEVDDLIIKSQFHQSASAKCEQRRKTSAAPKRYAESAAPSVIQGGQSFNSLNQTREKILSELCDLRDNSSQDSPQSLNRPGSLSTSFSESSCSPTKGIPHIGQYDACQSDSDVTSGNDSSDDGSDGYPCPICSRQSNDAIKHVIRRHLPWYVGLKFPLTESDGRKTRLAAQVMDYMCSCVTEDCSPPMPCVEAIWGRLLYGLLEFICDKLNYDSHQELLDVVLEKKLWVTKHVEHYDISSGDYLLSEIYQGYNKTKKHKIMFFPPNHPSALFHHVTLSNIIRRLPKTQQSEIRKYEAYSWDKSQPSIPSLSGLKLLSIPARPHANVKEVEEFLGSVCDGSLEAVRRMLEKNASLVRSTGAPWSSGTVTTALRYTMDKSRCLDMATLLLLQGADIDQADLRGWTALHCATGDNSRNTVRFLITWGADVTVKAKNGKSALDLAKDSDSDELLDLMRDTLMAMSRC